MARIQGEVNRGVLRAVRIAGSEAALGLGLKVTQRTVSNWLHRSIPSYRMSEIVEWSQGAIKVKEFFMREHASKLASEID